MPPAIPFLRLRTSPRWLRCAFVGAGLVNLWAAEPPKLSPAEAELAKQFAGVTQWQGIYDVSVTGAASLSRASGYHLESRYEAKAHGTFTLERSKDDDWDPARGLLTWQGNGEFQGGGLGTFSEWDGQGIGEEWSQEFGGVVGQERIEFSVRLGNKSAQLHAGAPLKEPLMRRTGRRVSVTSGGGGNKVANTVTPIDTTFPAPVDVWYLGASEADKARRWQVVGNGPGVLTFNYEGPASGRAQRFFVSGDGVTRRSKVILFPVYEDLEVEVTIADYAKWRPLGSIADPKKPGNRLVARATLQSKGGKAKGFPPIKEIRFELIDTSREPGVCLNWPLGAKDDAYDLRLATAGTGGALSASDQKLAVTDAGTDAQRRPYAEATIECFDFGARSELRVICELEDGRELIGLMKDEGGKQDIVRLPKMKGPDWIADVWRKEKNVEDLAAGYDGEKVVGQEHDGDGYSLYEEYRGWVVNGQHVEGDPEKKDFFVLNLIGPDAKGGLGLFGRLSKLRVHSKLRDAKEISQSERLMNGNHRDGPHRVDQHGVVISNVGQGVGGATIAIEGAEKGKAARPRSVNWVYIESRSHPAGAFSSKSSAEYNLSERDAQYAHDRAVAHELLHAVGVDHHGEAPWRLVKCNFQGASAPLNPTHRARFTTGFSLYTSQIATARDWSGDRGDTITLLWEDTGRDVVEESIAAYEAELAQRRAQNRTDDFVKDYAATAARLSTLGIAKDPAFWAESDADRMAAFDQFRRIRVGEQGGTDCGNELCVMRYYFADAYEISGRKNAYYLIRPGGNRAGRELCSSPVGTGTNGKSHQPQSRYGDAHSGRGNCFGQICPNDAIPPRSIVLK